MWKLPSRYRRSDPAGRDKDQGLKAQDQGPSQPNIEKWEGQRAKLLPPKPQTVV
jgi:hypothetical protein